MENGARTPVCRSMDKAKHYVRAWPVQASAKCLTRPGPRLDAVMCKEMHYRPPLGEKTNRTSVLILGRQINESSRRPMPGLSTPSGLRTRPAVGPFVNAPTALMQTAGSAPPWLDCGATGSETATSTTVRSPDFRHGNHLLPLRIRLLTLCGLSARKLRLRTPCSVSCAPLRAGAASDSHSGHGSCDSLSGNLHGDLRADFLRRLGDFA